MARSVTEPPTTTVAAEAAVASSRRRADRAGLHRALARCPTLSPSKVSYGMWYGAPAIAAPASPAPESSWLATCAAQAKITVELVAVNAMRTVTRFFWPPASPAVTRK